METNPDLLKIILTLAATGGFACLLHGRQQQRNQDCDNRDDNQQFDQRKTST